VRTNDAFNKCLPALIAREVPSSEFKQLKELYPRRSDRNASPQSARLRPKSPRNEGSRANSGGSNPQKQKAKIDSLTAGNRRKSRNDLDRNSSEASAGRSNAGPLERARARPSERTTWDRGSDRASGNQRQGRQQRYPRNSNSSSDRHAGLGRQGSNATHNRSQSGLNASSGQRKEHQRSSLTYPPEQQAPTQQSQPRPRSVPPPLTYASYSAAALGHAHQPTASARAAQPALIGGQAPITYQHNDTTYYACQGQDASTTSAQSMPSTQYTSWPPL